MPDVFKGNLELSMNELLLSGCAPVPLAHYLKALGVLRLLTEQLPAGLPRPRGCWRGETFVLHSPLDRAGLERFFLHEYRPTPILAPWNGGSGFFQGDNLSGISPLASSAATRFEDIKAGIASARRVLGVMALTEKPEKEVKEILVLRCRSEFPEPLLEWLDAALVLTGDGAKFPPLLGTGGNDGRLDFTNNFMQRIVELFDAATGSPADGCCDLLAGALFAEPTRGLGDNAIGQFFPHAAGGANGTSGFDAKSLVNPWDYILMLEGALLFAAAAVKRLESAGPGELAYPFSVRPSGFGYASSSDADGSARCEIWVPLWESPASLAELRQVLGEGRARLRDRAACDGFEFARAAAGLGVDRGLSAFQRFSFAQRNGLSFFATPLDRVPVRRRPRATSLLDELDRNDWLDRLRRQTRGDRVPNSVASAVRRLEQAALGLLRSGQSEGEESAAVEALLVAVGDAEGALARSVVWSKNKGLAPVPRLSGAWWSSLRPGGAEFDLAASLASLGDIPLRRHWEPLDAEKPWPVWNPNSREAVWSDSRLVETLLAVHQRRILLDGEDGAAFNATRFARPSSIAQFLEGATDDARIARLARALSLVKIPPQLAAEGRPAADSDRSAETFKNACAKLPALFVLPRLALAGRLPGYDEAIPRLVAILRRGASGDGAAATRLAANRLRASGYSPALSEVPAKGSAVQRALAATLFPVEPETLGILVEQLRPLATIA